jgi:hypothetical protein
LERLRQGEILAKATLERVLEGLEMEKPILIDELHAVDAEEFENLKLMANPFGSCPCWCSGKILKTGFLFMWPKR